MSFLAVGLFCWASLHDIERRHDWLHQRVLNWDIEAYYHYLPATIIHGDPRDLSYVKAVDDSLHPGSDCREFGFMRHPATGHHLIKYSYGTALFELPLFLMAHTWCTSPWSSHPADGYSVPYQLMVQLSTAFSVIIALFVLRAFLRRHVSDQAAAVALLVLGMGTNLYFYSTVATGMSHPYLFLVTALLIHQLDRWRPERRKALIIGALLGLAIITRPTEALLGIVVLLWPAVRSLRIAQSIRLLPWAALPIALLALPQLVYWKVTTGAWIVYSYGEEGFDFLHPHVLDGLFSAKKGWFVYSPLVMLGFLGLALMFVQRRSRAQALPIALYFVMAVLVAFSWHEWWYGGSFGCRALIGALPLLALPMAVLADRVYGMAFPFRFVLLAAVLLGIQLNFFQMEQYLATIIHWDAMTWDRYWQVFGKSTWEGLRPFP